MFVLGKIVQYSIKVARSYSDSTAELLEFFGDGQRVLCTFPRQMIADD